MEVGRSRDICRFNLRGICRFGQRCWNIHERPTRTFERTGLSETVSTSSQSASNEEAPSTSTVSDVISTVLTKEEDYEKTCGICFDNVLKKVNRSEQMFGLLPNCSHCFCYSCITRWRQSKEFDIEVSKSCPECRTASDFVYRSKVWMEQSDAKTTFIESKKQKMNKIHCKYFKRGKGYCPFGNKCLYLHALMDGTVVDVGEPKRRKRSQRAQLLESDLMAQLIIRLHVHAEGEDELDPELFDLLSSEQLYFDIFDDMDDDDDEDDAYDYEFEDDLDYDDLAYFM